jgi:hypothetical protein
MGYFDALASASFKTAADGRRLFFPWGVLVRLPFEAASLHAIRGTPAR